MGSATKSRSKRGHAVGRRRTSPDTSTYTGRLAARLRKLREQRGKSVDEMHTSLTSRRIGLDISRKTYYAWEAGSHDIPTHALPALAKALGIGVRELMPDR